MEECALTLNVSILCRRVVLYGWCLGRYRSKSPTFKCTPKGSAPWYRCKLTIELWADLILASRLTGVNDQSFCRIWPTATTVQSPSACYIMIVTIISPMDAAYLEAVSLYTSWSLALIIRRLKSDSLASKVSARNAAFGTSTRISILLHVVCLVSNVEHSPS